MQPLGFEKELANRRVFVTGHSGFTGSWLCFWLQMLNAKVFGYSLAPTENQPLSHLLGLDSSVDGIYADIMDFDALADAMAAFRPEVVIHLAAQPLVRRSYREPRETFAVNALGTANVLEAARSTGGVKGIVCITTDKVYENREWNWAYRENDPLGGKDPYSASKAAAELIIKSYASSFPPSSGAPAIATARGGNIVGGGDWSEDRLIPDFVRAVFTDVPLTLRFPDATRPWQHVLALAQGYLMLSSGLLSERSAHFARAWNLGPQELGEYSVRQVMEMLSAHWRRPQLEYLENPLAEAGSLALDSRLAHNQLGWRSVWSVEQTVRRTAEWYRAYEEKTRVGDLHPGCMAAFTRLQVDEWRSGIGMTER